MLTRSTLAVGLAMATCLPLSAQPEAPVLPGFRPDGTVQLPNQWKLNPAGTHLTVGDFPVNIALHPSGEFLAILHAGLEEHEIITVKLDGKQPVIVSRAVFEQTFQGLCFSPDGKRIFASGGEFERVHRFDFEDGFLGKPKVIDLSKPGIAKLVIGGVATNSDGSELFAAGTFGHALFRVRPDDNDAEPTVLRFDGNPAPYGILAAPDGKRLFVSLWGAAKVAVVDLDKYAVAEEWDTERHPTEMELSPAGDALYVSCANSTKVSVIDPTTGRSLQTIGCALHAQAPNGNTPSSLDLSPDGKLLFVANADANNLAVFNVEDRERAVPLGFIPTGWYPTSVRFNEKDKTIYVANGKGMLPKANRSGSVPSANQPKELREYIGSIFQGTLSTIPMPNPAMMAEYTKQAYACSPLRKEAAVNADEVPEGNPIPTKIGGESPIKYVIYVVKENRTYDQIFGDMPEGNGEPGICLFPEKVTPNHHKLAREFVLLDNCYVEGEVSADGHEWSMGAYATDFVEKSWPLTYRGGGKGTIGYPSEGSYDAIARPAGGYLWDRAKEAGVSYRSYGEWIANGATLDQPGKARVAALEGHFDPMFRGYDLDYTDVKRAERFISEVNRFEKEGDMPRLQIVRLPNDHTYGTRAGKPTPTAMVADNDLALGMLVEGVSKSTFWNETAIFVIEDDAQNGPDHVDAHRVAALVISPYVKRKSVDSTMYSTSSMLRTMELILGLKPMSQFDAAARPMYNSFTAEADPTPYTHVVPNADRDELNVAGAWGSEWSATANLAKEDAADDILFNEVIWKAVRGEASPMPAPVRAAFFLPEIDD